MTCDFSGEYSDIGEQDPGGSAGDCCLEILGESAASAEPGEGSLDDPSAWQKFKPLRVVGAFYALYGPFSDFFEASFQFRPSVSAIGEDMPQRRVFLADGFEHAIRGRQWICAFLDAMIGNGVPLFASASERNYILGLTEETKQKPVRLVANDYGVERGAAPIAPPGVLFSNIPKNLTPIIR